MNRRRFLALAAAAAANAGTPSIPPIIDAHIHLFDPTRPDGVPWPPRENAVLYRQALPPRYRTLAAPLGVRGAIASGVKTTRQTTGAGVYVLSPIPAGEYTVNVAAAGFQTFVQEHITVDALATVGLNINLKVGSAAEQVTVTDTPPVLDTQDARLGNTVRNDVYTNLPLAMGVGGIGAGPRNPGAFIYLMPGVTDANRWGQINGGQSFSKEVYVEGVAMTDTVQQGEGRYMGLGISIEAVEQFQIETSGQSVEFAGQGSENYVLKSGTNGFHGAAFEYLRNTHLDSRGFFDKVRAAEHQNEFGASLGGPVKQNRAFFFSSYDGYRYRTQTPTVITSIPTRNTPITGAFGLRAPHAFNQDLSLKRDFRIKEKVRLLFQWDAFNAFNNVRFSAPSTNTTSSNFGKITSQANTPRLMQVSTRIEF